MVQTQMCINDNFDDSNRTPINSSGNTVWVDLDTSIKYYEDAENVLII